MRTPASGSDADRSPPGAASLPRDGCSGLAASCGLRERRQDFATNLSAPLHAEGCGVLDPVHADEVHLGGDARGPGHRKRGAGAGVARVGRRRCDAGTVVRRGWILARRGALGQRLRERSYAADLGSLAGPGCFARGPGGVLEPGLAACLGEGFDFQPFKLRARATSRTPTSLFRSERQDREDTFAHASEKILAGIRVAFFI
mmetsp:Transcript_144509/g.463085  ORF Transcript_144509/g.463085 Transcript_144509/m.463085 type:complete len:202 (+) Transcript_144509:57-662(+)